MTTVNVLLRDAAINHAVDLQQFSLGVVRRMIALLNQSDARLSEELRLALDRLPPESFTVKRLEGLLDSVRQINKAAYARVERELKRVLRKFVVEEAAYQVRLLRTVLPDIVQKNFAVASVSADQVYTAALSRPFQGRLLREWASSVEAGRMAHVRNAVRLGYVEGETVDKIVRRIRGTREQGYSDGVLERSRRELTAVVDTAVKHMAATTQERIREANKDIIASVQWVSTLDGKTSTWCRVRDGLKYTVGTHKPIGHKIPWLGGPGKIHWRCRSTSIPVTKSFRQLGIDIDDVPPAQRASMDGQVPADMTFGEWLEKQSAYRQDQVVGPVRGQLMRRGELPFDAFYDERGRWLTLEQLRERNEEAFRRAGL